ncbi:hypothetical protein T439DRAFT_326756 [Meredithblackwellia eburnea MCA 4105]
MPKIRKKTTRRTTTHMREKVKRKVSEAHKKQKKQAKKDVTWKSNKPKDIGIPNSFPYKEQLLAEAQAEKVRLEEERQARREAQKAGNAAGATLASTAALAAALAADSQRVEDEMALDDEEDGSGEVKVADASLKLHAKSLRKVLEASDVVIEVLDARDPVGTRCRAVERELRSLDGGRKKLVIVLNKIDLVPPAVVQSWLAHLRQQAPTLPFKSSTQQQRTNLSSSSLHTPSSASGSSTKPLMELIKGFRHANAPTPANSSEQKVKQSLTIGLIGHPNVGKSSIINTLKRSKACSVAPTPGWTKEVQEVVLEKGVRVLDCPGVVVEARGETEGALRGMVKVEDLNDPKAPVEAILQRCKKEHLMMLYNIPHFDGITDFLVEVARGKGRLRKGGVPDLNGTARSVVRDWVSGRIPYYVSPPAVAPGTASTSANVAPAQISSNIGTVSSSDVNSSALLTSFAPAFDLAALFGEADAVAFGEGASSSVAKAVRMDGVQEESEDADLGWAMEDEEEEESDLEGMEDDGLNVDDLLDDEDEIEGEDDDQDAMEDDSAAPAPLPLSKKRSAPTSTPSGIVSVAPSAKKAKSVTFASKALGPTGSGSTTPTAATANKQSLTTCLEVDVSLNKSIKQAAKKNKKKAAKEAARVMAVESEFGQDGDLPSKPRPAQVIKSSTVEVEAPYDFMEFFGKGQQAQQQAQDSEEEEL